MKDIQISLQSRAGNASITVNGKLYPVTKANIDCAEQLTAALIAYMQVTYYGGKVGGSMRDTGQLMRTLHPARSRAWLPLSSPCQHIPRVATTRANNGFMC